MKSGRGVSLDARFSIEKTSGREPNKCIMTVYKLSKERSESLSDADQVTIIAGYTGRTATLFSGDIDRVYSKREKGDRATVIEADDSGRTYRRTRVNRSFIANTRVSEVMRYLVGELGIGEGNLSDFENVTERDNSPEFFETGYVVSGTAYRALDEIIRSKNLRWSIQDGVLQIQRRNTPLNTTVIVLKNGTGLIGSPEKDLGKKNNRRNQENTKVNCQAYLLPGLYIGRVVRLESEEITGNYQIKKATYTGQLMSVSEWTASLVLEEY
jgi:hypothetical protein